MLKKLKEKLFDFDSFQGQVKLNFAGQQSIPSWTGLFVSIVMYLTILAYAIQMGQILVFKKDPIINTSVSSSYYSAHDIITFEELEFEIAFGVIDYSTSQVLDDPAHVRWNVYLEEREDLKVVKETKLAIHICNEEDFSRFYPVASSNTRFLKSL